MTQLSILKASEFCGKDRKTLYRDIKKGKLSATNSRDGTLQLETSELIRVYGESSLNSVAEISIATAIENVKVAALRQEIESLKERLSDKERHIEDLRTSIKLLEHTSAKKRWGFW